MKRSVRKRSSSPSSPPDSTMRGISVDTNHSPLHTASPPGSPPAHAAVDEAATTDKAPATKGQSRRTMLYLTLFLHSLSTGITMPVLPDLITQLYSGSIADASSFTAYTAALAAGMQFISNPFWGKLSDQHAAVMACPSTSRSWRRFTASKHLLIGSLFFFAVEQTYLAFAPSAPVIVFFSVVRGVTGIVFSISSAILVETAKEGAAAKEGLAQLFGMMGAVIGLSFIVGPVVGGILANNGQIGRDHSIAGGSSVQDLLPDDNAEEQTALFLPFMLSALVEWANVLVTWWWMSHAFYAAAGAATSHAADNNSNKAHADTTKQRSSSKSTSLEKNQMLPEHAPLLIDRSDTTSSTAASVGSSSSSSSSPTSISFSLNPLKPLAILNATPFLLAMSIGFFLVILATGVVRIWLLYAKYRFGWDALTNGRFLGYIGLMMIIGQGLLPKYLVRVWSDATLVLVTAVVTILSYVTYGAITVGWWMYVAVTVGVVGFALSPSIKGVISEELPLELQGQLQGALGALVTLGQVFGPLWAGAALAYFISDERTVKIPGAPFFIGAFVIFLGLCSFVVAFRCYGHHREYARTRIFKA